MEYTCPVCGYQHLGEPAWDQGSRMTAEELRSLALAGCEKNGPVRTPALKRRQDVRAALEKLGWFAKPVSFAKGQEVPCSC
jgi:hypothetical protein